MQMIETEMNQNISISLDLGSLSMKGIALDQRYQILHRICLPIKGQWLTTLQKLLQSFSSVFPPEHCHIEALTGSNAQLCSEQFRIRPTNDMVASFLGTVKVVPQAGSILEIGGEHAHFIRLQPHGNGIEAKLKDFFVNSACLAGTGAFLDQEAHRLHISLIDLSSLAVSSIEPIPIAGRCAVFAKTDIIHQTQNGVPLKDIAGALCKMVAANISAQLISGREYTKPLVFVGGVAANKGVVKSLHEILRLDEDSLIIPNDFLFINAIGAFLFSKKNPDRNCYSLAECQARLGDKSPVVLLKSKTLSPLGNSQPASSSTKVEFERLNYSLEGCGIGIDVGSTSTNLLCIAANGNVLDGYSLPTRGQALQTVHIGLQHFNQKYRHFMPGAVGVTGSGRKFIAEIIGADSVMNEISAHAVGGAALYPETDTIFDIGGQDSKFINLDHGLVTAFEMNKVCSAGTGSFLEEVSELLGMDIINEFAREAIRSENPTDLSERCTVFIMSELIRKEREGYRREDLAAGLCYSVVKNYLSRVVNRHRIGKFISFQGGVAGNAAVVLTMERILQRSVHVHKYHEFAGALGAALIAKRDVRGVSRFYGFKDFEIASIKTNTFICKKCLNNCTIHSTSNRFGRKFFAGASCDIFDERMPLKDLGGPHDSVDLLDIRYSALNEHVRSPKANVSINSILGIPRALLFHELLPFWTTFFNTIGVNYTLSGETTKKTIQKGTLLCPSSPCLPMKIAYGQCTELMEKGITKLFIPSIMNLHFRTEEERLNHVCPSVQAWPFTAKACLPDNLRLLTPTVRFAIPHFLDLDIMSFGSTLGYEGMETIKALRNALDAQNRFYQTTADYGKQILTQIDENKTYAVVLSRPYILFDLQTRLALKRIFNELGIIAIPIDALEENPLSSTELGGMYWYFGKRFLQAAHAVKKLSNIVVIHLSTFGCGSDSFLVHFLRQQFTEIPFLELEIDEHSEFIGVATRLEAFVESLKGKRLCKVEQQAIVSGELNQELRKRKLLIPQMSDHAFPISAAFRSCGINAKVLPLPDEESISWGKQAVTGGECFPCVAIVGDMLRYLHGNSKNADGDAFFMISGDGPCRLGQYPYLQRLILSECGYQDIPIFNASQDPHFYDRMGSIASALKTRAWRGTVATDLLFRKWRELRPYCHDKISCDKVYREELQNLSYCVEHNMSLRNQLKKSFDRLESISGPVETRRAIVAVLGENYVRCNSFANAEIANALEELGAETCFPSLYEWIYYTNWTAQLHCRYEKQYHNLLKLLFIDKVQHWYANQLMTSIKGRLRNLHEPSIRQIFQMSSRYVPNTFEGETLISIGGTIDFHNKGACGVVHVVPFGCIVGTIVETLCDRISRDLNDFPIITIYTDSQIQNLPLTKLEGFWIRAQSWKSPKGNNR
jgi:predicted CoA-substrate-specific enzyme activase